MLSAVTVHSGTPCRGEPAHYYKAEYRPAQYSETIKKGYPKSDILFSELLITVSGEGT